MSFKTLVLALPLLALSPLHAKETKVPAKDVATSLEKRGLPCVEELCIGDGLADLGKIKWSMAEQPIKSNDKVVYTHARTLSESELQSLKQTFPDPSQAGAYIHDKQFDAMALPGLQKIQAACETNELFGRFVSPNGTATRVGISLLPVAADPTKQVWTVTTISREFPGVTNNQERAVVNEELKKRYFKFGAGNQDITEPKTGEGRFFMNGMQRFGFALSMYRGNDEAKRMKMHPACGGK